MCTSSNIGASVDLLELCSVHMYNGLIIIFNSLYTKGNVLGVPKVASEIYIFT